MRRQDKTRQDVDEKGGQVGEQAILCAVVLVEIGGVGLGGGSLSRSAQQVWNGNEVTEAMEARQEE